ncbi:hypothetical protein MCAV_01660 [[Mycoplasma] cavipharyngis]|uniref:hypothetical protein n=1 Tax=[Mycoplasma] cavipharyngis TaxID=92757 RepID=UPI003704B3E7
MNQLQNLNPPTYITSIFKIYKLKFILYAVIILLSIITTVIYVLIAFPNQNVNKLNLIAGFFANLISRDIGSKINGIVSKPNQPYLLFFAGLIVIFVGIIAIVSNAISVFGYAKLTVASLIIKELDNKKLAKTALASIILNWIGLGLITFIIDIVIFFKLLKLKKVYNKSENDPNKINQ